MNLCESVVLLESGEYLRRRHYMQSVVRNMMCYGSWQLAYIVQFCAPVVAVVVKVAIDQFIQAPALLALIITGLAFMEGRGINGIRTDMQEDYIYSLIQNCEFL